MGVFQDDDPERPQRLDWKILQNGAISLYFDRRILEKACDWFREHGYRLLFFDCAPWEKVEELFEAVKTALDLPAYYGNDLDSLREYLSDVEVSQEGGIVFAFYRFDVLWRRWPDFSWQLLDMLENHSRARLLFGERLLVLIQSNVQDFSLLPVGGSPILLNPDEYLFELRKKLQKGGSISDENAPSSQ